LLGRDNEFGILPEALSTIGEAAFTVDTGRFPISECAVGYDKPAYTLISRPELEVKESLPCIALEGRLARDDRPLALAESDALPLPISPILSCCWIPRS
jgi:hypothetical protein